MVIHTKVRKLVKSTKSEQVLAAANCGSSVVEDRKAQLVEVCRISDRIDCDDLAVPHRETQEEHQPPTRGHNESHCSVHEHRSCELGTSCELPGHPRCTTDLPCRACRHGCAVGSEHDVRVEHRQQRVEGTFARGGEESINYFSLVGEIGVGDPR